MIIIKPSAAIRNNYNEISRICKETGEPVYLTKNGEGDLVVLDIRAYTMQKEKLDLEAKLMQIRDARKNGSMKSYTLEELKENMDNIVREAEENEK
ncbi:MAG: type II toxin-antitoxin system Phd/YefM family antitoxin [Clostridiales bacterium]|nr:type II toxin-antitoxin system Phd/YefM family antitoxin [Clostridiales bacterium]